MLNCRVLVMLLGLMGVGGWVSCPEASAVIINSSDGAGNVTAPSDDPGWANVGNRGGDTGIYLGNRWVLTADHVGAGTIILNGRTYASTGQSFRLHAPGDASTAADVIMYRLTADPGLAGLMIRSSAVTAGASVTMIGHGDDRQANKIYWNSDWSVNTLPAHVGATYRGYAWDTSRRAMRWGTNVVSGGDQTINVGYGPVEVFATTFQDNSNANEGQVASGDSGGAMFIKNTLSGQWELAGMLDAMGKYSGQPVNTSVYGNLSYAADLSAYRDQIVSLEAVPNPATVALMVGGGLLMVLPRRRKRESGTPER